MFGTCGRKRRPKAGFGAHGRFSVGYDNGAAPVSSMTHGFGGIRPVGAEWGKEPPGYPLRNCRRALTSSDISRSMRSASIGRLIGLASLKSGW